MSIKNNDNHRLVSDAVAQASFLLDLMDKNGRAGKVTVEFNRSAERIGSVTISSSETIKT